MDETNNDFDSDNDEKPQLTSKGEVIPKNKIVVMEQASVSDVMKKKSGKKRSPTHFSQSEKVIFFHHGHIFIKKLPLIST